MADISVTRIGQTAFRVEVKEGSSNTVHDVTASNADIERYGGGAPAERLVERSSRDRALLPRIRTRDSQATSVKGLSRPLFCPNPFVQDTRSARFKTSHPEGHIHVPLFFHNGRVAMGRHCCPPFHRSGSGAYPARPTYSH